MDQLRDKLESMRKRMGLEMFDDLDEFENVVSAMNISSIGFLKAVISALP